MAKQSKPKSAGKAKAKAAAVKSLPAAARATTKAAARSNSTITADRSEQKKTRGLNIVVRDLISKKFPSIREQEVKHNVVDGMSLFDFVSAQKVRNAHAGIYFDDIFGRVAERSMASLHPRLFLARC